MSVYSRTIIIRRNRGGMAVRLQSEWPVNPTLPPNKYEGKSIQELLDAGVKVFVGENPIPVVVDGIANWKDVVM